MREKIKKLLGVKKADYFTKDLLEEEGLSSREENASTLKNEKDASNDKEDLTPNLPYSKEFPVLVPYRDPADCYMTVGEVQ